jgi:hypothetical protein
VLKLAEVEQEIVQAIMDQANVSDLLITFGISNPYDPLLEPKDFLVKYWLILCASNESCHLSRTWSTWKIA